MLTAIEIENFKGIRDRVRIELRPITLLFGPNSAGKSSILQAIQYAHQILKGEGLNEFADLVHGRDLSLPMTFRLTVTRDDYDPEVARLLQGVHLPFAMEYTKTLLTNVPDEGVKLPENLSGWLKRKQPYAQSEEPADSGYCSLPVVGGIWTADVEFTIQWSPAKRRPHITRYQTWANGESFGQLVSDPDTGKCTLIDFAFHHSVLPSYFIPDSRSWWETSPWIKLEEELRALSLEEDWQHRSISFEDLLSSDDPPDRDSTLADVKAYIRKRPQLEQNNELAETGDGWQDRAAFFYNWMNPSAGVPARTGPALPDFEESSFGLVPVWSDEDEMEFQNDPTLEIATEEREAYLAAADVAAVYTGFAMTRVGRFVRDEAAKFAHVQPLRETQLLEYLAGKPRRKAEVGIWGTLANRRKVQIKAVSDWLGDANRLDTGYHLKVKKYVGIELDSDEFENIETQLAAGNSTRFLEVLQASEKKPYLVLVPVGKNEPDLFPWQVGVGVSQIVPVVAASLDTPSRLQLIEQPELHLHPRLQTRLGELFIEGYKSGAKPLLGYYWKGNRFLIETHSEHLLLRLLRRIRETSEGSKPEHHPGLTPDDVRVYFVEQMDGRTVVRKPLRIDETGEFIDRWPHGFFDEREEELFGP